MKAYLNGAEIYSGLADFINTNDSPFFIGRDMPGNDEYFKGALDDIRLYNHALSNAEILTLYGEDTNTATNYCQEPTEGNNTKNPKINFVVATTQIPNQKAVGKIEIIDSCIIHTTQPKLICYDSKKVDGDTVTIYLNKDIVFDRIALKGRKNAFEKEVSLQKNKEYLLISKAWNLGKIKPNTLTIELWDDKKNIVKFSIDSEIGVSRAFKIIVE